MITSQPAIPKMPTNGTVTAPATPRVSSESGNDKLVQSIVDQVMSTLGTPQIAVGATDAAGAFAGFATQLEELVTSSPELLEFMRASIAKNLRSTIGSMTGKSPSLEEVAAMLEGSTISSKGGTVVRTFWWGFHIQVSHEDLQTFITTATTVTAILGLIGGLVPSPAQPFLAAAAAFIAGALQLLASLDQGKGVYISMTWFAVGAFVPTTVV